MYIIQFVYYLCSKNPRHSCGGVFEGVLFFAALALYKGDLYGLFLLWRLFLRHR